MNNPILRVEQLSTQLGNPEKPVRAVDDISFDIHPGETLALLGESGCGKSVTALSLMRLLPPSGRIVKGQVLFQDQDLLKLPESRMRSVRGSGISMVFQEPMTALNPVITVGRQIFESMQSHSDDKGGPTWDMVIDLLQAVGIPQPEKTANVYPHQLSGGMKQRVVIAIALANRPKLLIADEPTTALDVTIQAQVLDLMRKLQSDMGMAVLLITHDLGVVNQMADRVAVMYAGQIIELSDRQAFFSSPRHPYSQKLFESVPDMNKRGQALNVISGNVPPLDSEFRGCRFETRCHRAWNLCRTTAPEWSTTADAGVLCHIYADDFDRRTDAVIDARNDIPKKNTSETLSGEVRTEGDTGKDTAAPLLSVQDLQVHFPRKSGLFRRTTGYVRAVDGVDVSLAAGKTLALVGESGSGKTTAGKGIIQLIRPTGGTVEFEGNELTKIGGLALRNVRSELQIIFQDPFSSMNPRMQVADVICEGLRARRVALSDADKRRLIGDLLVQVGLPADSGGRYPHEFSGGQRQRISIARALALKPRLIVCDEPTSALDVSVQAQILNLLKELQRRLGISYLFITHDISVVAYLAHEVAVMYLGRIVESGPVSEILNRPRHPYTQALLAAVPRLDSGRDNLTAHLGGDIPSPLEPPVGCHFHPRCTQAIKQCKSSYPGVSSFGGGHTAHCHLYTPET